jgi:anti-sigma factor (TIGR02949 family)
MPHDEKCHHLLESLSEYVDGQLRDDLCLILEQHLAECSNCRIVVDTLRQTVYLYHTSAQSAEVPSDVRERLFRKLDLGDFLE